jgi:hypothetical protein
MKNHGYLAKLQRAGNIGVALGKVSHGLVTIDLDHNGYIESLLDANPLLRKTLRTTAQRGCNIWLRCTSDCPSSCKLKDQSGNEIGEWRADGNQTIITGTHPEGMPYRFVVEGPVIPISYDAIIWPNSIIPPHATESKRVRRVRRAGEKEVVSVSAGCKQIQKFVGDNDLIAQVAPTDYHQNNASLFKLARAVKSYENAARRPATRAELEFVFDRWSLIARPFWRSELTRDDYYAEFLDAYSYADFGIDENPIEVAISRAKAAPLPDLPGISDERIRLLAAICREMQVLTGDKPFFVSTRKVGEIFGVHWTQAGCWLRILERPLKVIHLAPGEVRKRGGSRSPRYHCDISLPSARRSGQCKTAAGLQTKGHQCRGRLQFSNESTLAAAAAASVQLNEAAKES